MLLSKPLKKMNDKAEKTYRVFLEKLALRHPTSRIINFGDAWLAF